MGKVEVSQSLGKKKKKSDFQWTQVFNSWVYNTISNTGKKKMTIQLQSKFDWAPSWHISASTMKKSAA